ncbi:MULTISPECIES: polysaccharide biosynthesis/export family protein [Mameliella]|uniref:Polysaccharide biosynthesis protein n=1 Tax=Mameliella alba TaxID=561184 RepID=A0A0B3S713_9RHOB|nr:MULTISPECIES: polysaccharide biosynthesis/export family protein [Mameliella]MCR9273136.1 polysaccharide export protein [Paracoccaceae bacterium]KHQ52451.1 Polysaccharide biosynthesis protein [Mameliella alba]MDD9731980.1 polysaccharide export protein [Mameliella sp. AT18]PTR38032.1 polysaccharide export outer membrane protein [Mameliella alba]SDD56146.1 polysaccharide export outer membrane protein [Mameliella alba]
MSAKLRLITLLAAVLALAACSLPRGAAIQSEVLNQKDAEKPTFQVIEVTRENVPGLATWSASGWHGHYHWPNTSHGSSSSVIRTGDRIDIIIWDSQDNSLLTSPGERFAEIKGVEVDSQGSIFLPYVNKVGVRGLTATGARAKIQERLAPILPSAQVQLNLQQGRDHTVDVVGGVGKPGAYPLPSRNYKVLNLLADSGGVMPDLRNPRIRLLRGSKTYEISVSQLLSDGSKNALLLPRDTVVIEQDDRSFTALGASGIENLIYFPKDYVTALEAVSLMGGLSDTRADPKGVLVLREYPAKAISPTGHGPRMQQVVFTLDLTTADGLFAARKFQIQPDDTVLATESPITSAQTIFGMVGAVLGVSAQANAISN